MNILHRYNQTCPGKNKHTRGRSEPAKTTKRRANDGPVSPPARTAPTNQIVWPSAEYCGSILSGGLEAIELRKRPFGPAVERNWKQFRTLISNLPIHVQISLVRDFDRKNIAKSNDRMANFRDEHLLTPLQGGGCKMALNQTQHAQDLLFRQQEVAHVQWAHRAVENLGEKALADLSARALTPRTINRIKVDYMTKVAAIPEHWRPAKPKAKLEKNGKWAKRNLSDAQQEFKQLRSRAQRHVRDARRNARQSAVPDAAVMKAIESAQPRQPPAAQAEVVKGAPYQQTRADRAELSRNDLKYSSFTGPNDKTYQWFKDAMAQELIKLKAYGGEPDFPRDPAAKFEENHAYDNFHVYEKLAHIAGSRALLAAYRTPKGREVFEEDQREWATLWPLAYHPDRRNRLSRAQPASPAVAKRSRALDDGPHTSNPRDSRESSSHGEETEEDDVGPGRGGGRGRGRGRGRGGSEAPRGPEKGPNRPEDKRDALKASYAKAATDAKPALDDPKASAEDKEKIVKDKEKQERELFETLRMKYASQAPPNQEGHSSDGTDRVYDFVLAADPNLAPEEHHLLDCAVLPNECIRAQDYIRLANFGNRVPVISPLHPLERQHEPMEFTERPPVWLNDRYHCGGIADPEPYGPWDAHMTFALQAAHAVLIPIEAGLNLTSRVASTTANFGLRTALGTARLARSAVVSVATGHDPNGSRPRRLAWLTSKVCDIADRYETGKKIVDGATEAVKYIKTDVIDEIRSMSRENGFDECAVYRTLDSAKYVERPRIVCRATISQLLHDPAEDTPGARNNDYTPSELDQRPLEDRRVGLIGNPKYARIKVVAYHIQPANRFVTHLIGSETVTLLPTMEGVFDFATHSANLERGGSDIRAQVKRTVDKCMAVKSLNYHPAGKPTPTSHGLAALAVLAAAHSRHYHLGLNEAQRGLAPPPSGHTELGISVPSSSTLPRQSCESKSRK
jgi:hypothetical protein